MFIRLTTGDHFLLPKSSLCVLHTSMYMVSSKVVWQEDRYGFLYDIFSNITCSQCYKTIFGGNLENLDLPFNWNNKNTSF